MTFHVIKTVSRPDISIEFYSWSTVALQHYTDTYDTTGKRISSTRTLSPDGLIYTTTSIWADQSYYQETLSDPVVVQVLNEQATYCTSYNIISTIETQIV